MLSLLLVTGTACGRGQRQMDLYPVLEQGAFLPSSDLVHLMPTSGAGREREDRFWVPKPLVPIAGWGVANRGWRPLGEQARLRYWRRSAGSTDLFFQFWRRSSQRSVQQTVSVTVNGERLGAVGFRGRHAVGRLPVPAHALSGSMVVEFAFEPPIYQPAADSQLLGLRRIGMLAPHEQPEEAPVEPQADPRRRVLGLPVTGSLVAPLEIPKGCRELVLSIRLAGLRSPVPGVAFRISALGLDRGHWQLLELRQGDLSSRWLGQRLPLEALCGKRVNLVLEVQIQGDVGRLEIRDPYIALGDSEPEIDHQTSGGSTVAIAGPDGERRRPDVVLVVLDAARGDRFGAWDYPRQTTPHIDRMARQALVFDRAYAECPTTSCSVPHLITGETFLEVGDIWAGWQLGDEVVTLAEYLHQAGYRTVGLSATPNNSVSRNSHQGFDEFRELWGPGNPHHGPYGLSRLAIEAIGDQPPAEPLFLQLHYLAPHQPYDPPHEFDRFTDPAYEGPITRRMSLKPFNLGVETLAEPDLRQLIGLYDGNLLLVDDALHRVFAALKETGRWENSLLLITSDHGEAFMEHGRQGHNTTLFDEMLHVPFILRLPGGRVPSKVDTQRLVSLADAVPTVLGVLGLRPAPAVSGVDLLQSPADPDRPRVLYARTSHRKNPLLSVRTPRWKIVVQPNKQVQMLFDLESDPRETDNLVAEQPLVFAGLGLLLRRTLEQTGRHRPPQERVRLPAEEVEVLRGLGYVN